MTKTCSSSRVLFRGAGARLSLGVLLVAAVSGCGGGQDSPTETVNTFYGHVAESEFGEACAMVDSGLQEQLQRLTGKPCEILTAERATEELRRLMADVEVDESMIKVTGDTAHVPEEAISFSDTPSSEGSLDLVLREDRWVIAGGGS
ncbi:hypothetical protein CLV92_1208 [Kineococcus xinjiangensis]|uniref:DUF4878 domain-containing protein n=1 Tax=Kineococcus xinjiangensis TaxID=512762 RepID=A0A2S6ICF7_9ACTN|nr:hypothetical protein [Kineococcus xinjiangensis]PPK91889.1 hypothetical protein CLV92_1208 [Kineococcus xinjiangensis]